MEPWKSILIAMTWLQVTTENICEANQTFGIQEWDPRIWLLFIPFSCNFVITVIIIIEFDNCVQNALQLNRKITVRKPVNNKTRNIVLD